MSMGRPPLKLADWLAANRAKRCAVIAGSLNATEAGQPGTVELKLAAGKRADLEYLRSSTNAPSKVSNFELELIRAGKGRASWRGSAERSLDDVAGTPRVRMPFG